MTNRIKVTWLSLLSVLLFAFVTPTFAQEAPVDPQVVQEANESVEADVQAETDKATAEQREKIMQEAVNALDTTKDALKALEEQRIDDALDALALTVGKLELIVARDPELALAPIDVAVVEHDLYATTDAIKTAIKQAGKALKDGKVQEARRLLSGIRSEMVIETTNLPLATYPDAIRAIAPLIDEGKMDEAKASLRAALGTLVVTEDIVPLPVLRAELLLALAEELTEKSDRTDAENEELSDTLAAVRHQLEMAELLGYGDHDDYKPLHAELNDIEKKIEEGASGEGFFDKMKDAMSDLWSSITS